MNNFKFGKRSKENLAGTKQKVRELAELALMYSTVDFSVIDGLRTTEQQQEMFKAGKSELDGVYKKSDHQSGKAIDVIPYVDDIDIWAVDNPKVAFVWLELYRALMRAAMKLDMKIEFGVAYNIGGGRDYPHISWKDTI